MSTENRDKELIAAWLAVRPGQDLPAGDEAVVTAQLVPYLEGTLSEVEAEAVEAWLLTAPDHQEIMVNARAALADPAEVDAGRLAQLSKAVQAGLPKPEKSAASWSFSFAGLLRPVPLLAAALLLCIAAGSGYQLGQAEASEIELVKVATSPVIKSIDLFGSDSF